jgi:pSer/pThr/pTyr-binding forkhead associated (FHA) protein
MHAARTGAAWADCARVTIQSGPVASENVDVGIRPVQLKAGSTMVFTLRIGHRRFVLAPGINSIGRDPLSTVCISDSSVSRAHARITVEGGQARLEDLHSKNGTTVQGEVVSGVSMLRDGDQIEFGDVKSWFIVELGGEPPTTTQL